MDKGIRPACNAKFLELLPTRVNTREGNTAFRKTVIAFVMEEWGTTLASAATHYNHAFINARQLAVENPELALQLMGLGRPEDKKGGRKPKAAAAPATPEAEEECLTVAELVGLVPDDEAEPAPEAEVVVQAAPVEFIDAQVGVPQYEEQTVFTVRKKSDDSVVAEGLSFEDARALVDKAAAAKKAKLYWV